MIFVTTDDTQKALAVSIIQNLEGVYDITIEKHVSKRSLAQNRLLRLWLGVISDETGNAPDDLHELFKVKFLGVDEISVMGSSIIRAKSTTKLNTKEFTAYLDRVEGLANSIGITLPHPTTIYDEAYGR